MTRVTKSESKPGKDDTAKAPEAAKAALPAGKKKLLIIVGAVVLLIGGGAGAFVAGALDGVLGKATPDEAATEKPAAPIETSFFALPDMVVSLNTGERKTTFLKMRVSLELTNPADQAKIERVMPRVIDYCQVYLRELRLDDLRGSAGTLRLREELLRRINVAVAPVVVANVLLTELFIQ